MKRRLKEETVIFISVFKWLVLATAAGIIAGASTALFVKTLNWTALVAGNYRYYFLLLPAGLILSALIVRLLLPEAEGHGADWVIASVHKRAGKMKAVVVPVEFLATVATLASGGSAGKEGPSAQIGAGLASVFADILGLDGVDRKKLVVCGIGGGFASVFGTPIAGAIFGIEVLSAGTIAYEILLPSFTAGIVSYQVSSWMGLTYLYRPLNLVPSFSWVFLLKIVVAGVFFGLASFMLSEVMRLGKRLCVRSGAPGYLKGLFAGLLLIMLTFGFSTIYLGLGVETIERCLDGGRVPWYAFIMKAVYTSATLNFGGSGGMGTPIFFVGATAGSAFSSAVGLDPALLASIGFVSLLAGAANTPIAASIMAVELFGSPVAPYAAISSVISFVIAGHRSVYPSQVLAVRKSSSLDVELGAELNAAEPVYRRREKSLTAILLGLLKRRP